MQSSQFESRISRLPYLALLALVAGMQSVFWQESEDAFAPVEGLWVKVLIPLAFVPLIWGLGGPGLKRLFKPWPARALGLFCAWLWVSAALGASPSAGLKTAFEYTLYAALFFVPALITESRRRGVMAAFFAACLMAAFLGFLQHFDLDPWHWSTNFGGRPLGTIGNPDFFAGHLVMAWALSLALFLGAPEKKRLMPGLVFAFMSLVQAWSLTVGAYLGMAAALAALGAYLFSGKAGKLLESWNLSRKKLVILMAGAVLFAGGALMLPPVKAKIIGIRQAKQVSVVNRTMMWKAAVDMWKEKPLMGQGLASFRPLFPLYQSRILNKEKGFNYVVTWLPHENYLYFLSETGLIGLCLFLLATVSGLWLGWIRLGDSRDPWLLGCFLGVAGMQGVSLLNTFSNIHPSAIAYWFLLGMIVYQPPKFESAQVQPSSLIPLALSLNSVIAASLISLVFGLFAGRQLAANRCLREANRGVRRQAFEASLPLFKKAVVMNVWELKQQTIVGAWYDYGEALRQTGRVKEAQEAYAADLVENPWCPEVNNMLGASLGQLGRGAEATQRLENAILISPGYTAAMLNLGITYVQAGNVSGAAKVWEDVVKLEPVNQQAKDYLAKIKGMKSN